MKSIRYVTAMKNYAHSKTRRRGDRHTIFVIIGVSAFGMVCKGSFLHNNVHDKTFMIRFQYYSFLSSRKYLKEGTWKLLYNEFKVYIILLETITQLKNTEFEHLNIFLLKLNTA